MKKRFISGLAAAVLALSGGGVVADTGFAGLFGGTDIRASAFSGWCVSGDCDVIFDEDGTVTVRKNGTKGAMDNNTVTWGDYKKYIKKLVIEEDITVIADDGFRFCSNLNTIIVKAKTPPKFPYYYSNGNFYGCSSNLKIYVPLESIRAYKGASGWNKYAFQIEAIPDTVSTTPTVSSIAYNEKYHQFRINWSAVDGAQNYGVAVYLAGKWKVQKQDIPASTTSFTSPKLKAGQTYRMVVCAKVNGKWDISNIEKRAFNVTIQ